MPFPIITLELPTAATPRTGDVRAGQPRVHALSPGANLLARGAKRQNARREENALSQAHLELVNEALSGSAGAARELVELLAPVVQARVARALMQRGAVVGRSIRQEVEDLSQDVFVALFADGGRALRAWEPARGLSLPNFVGLLAQRQTISIMRSGRRSPWRDDPAEMHVIEGVPERREPAETQIASRELLGQLLARLREALSPRGLELFQRLIVDQEPVDQVCELTGLTPAAVYAWRSRLGKLVKRLADEIQQSDTTAAPPLSDRAREARSSQVERSQGRPS